MSTVLYSVDKELLYPLFVSVLQSSQNINSVNFFKKKNLFIWLYWVLVAHASSLQHAGFFFSCSMWNLLVVVCKISAASCGI